jgi:hypothetical protein
MGIQLSDVEGDQGTDVCLINLDSKDQPLIEDIRLLGRILGDTIRLQEGRDSFERVEFIRRLSVAYRRDANELAGKKLEKYSLESFSTIVFYTDVKQVPGKPNIHSFRTMNANDTCKTPMEMFESDLIPNDLVEVNKAIREYYGI